MHLVDRGAQPLVVEGRLGLVEGEDQRAGVGLADELDVIRLLQRERVARRQRRGELAADHVHVTRTQRGEARLRIRDHVQLEPGVRGLGAPIPLVAGEGRPVAVGLVQHPRTGADRRGVQAVRVDRLRAEHPDRADVAELLQRRRIRLLELEHERPRVHDLHRSEHTRDAEPFGVILARPALEVPLHGRGVQRRPVGEGHALTERERVRLAVLAHLPRLGQARADLAAALVLDEPFEQQVLDVELARVVVWIEVAGARR